MLKKRVIFTLLFDNGQFLLSRNFRLQKVGNLSWLERNYNFADVAFHIDELIVIDVSRNQRDLDSFCAMLEQVSSGCFAPITAGGGVTSVSHAKRLLRSGADKVLVNTALFEDPAFSRTLAREFGQQCVVASIDTKKTAENCYAICTDNGRKILEKPAKEAITTIDPDSIGEIYLNCIDRDGTGQGYDFETIELLPKHWKHPLILAGGVGNAKHFSEGLSDSRVDAVATAHLFNFVGDGLKMARQTLLDEGVLLATWPDIEAVKLKIQKCE